MTGEKGTETVKNNTRPRMVQALLAALVLAFVIGAAHGEAASANKTDTTKLEERIMHSRAFEAVIWSVPLLNYKAMRDGYMDLELDIADSVPEIELLSDLL